MSPARGTFIALATAPGSVASDNPAETNGLFTKYLLDAMRRPGLGLDDVFNLVRERVFRDCNEKQIPWTLSSVIVTCPR